LAVDKVIAAITRLTFWVHPIYCSVPYVSYSENP